MPLLDGTGKVTIGDLQQRRLGLSNTRHLSSHRTLTTMFDSYALPRTSERRNPATESDEDLDYKGYNPQVLTRRERREFINNFHAGPQDGYDPDNQTNAFFGSSDGGSNVSVRSFGGGSTTSGAPTISTASTLTSLSALSTNYQGSISPLTGSGGVSLPRHTPTQTAMIPEESALSQPLTQRNLNMYNAAAARMPVGAKAKQPSGAKAKHHPEPKTKHPAVSKDCNRTVRGASRKSKVAKPRVAESDAPITEKRPVGDNAKQSSGAKAKPHPEPKAKHPGISKNSNHTARITRSKSKAAKASVAESGASAAGPAAARAEKKEDLRALFVMDALDMYDRNKGEVEFVLVPKRVSKAAFMQGVELLSPSSRTSFRAPASHPEIVRGPQASGGRSIVTGETAPCARARQDSLTPEDSASNVASNRSEIHSLNSPSAHEDSSHNVYRQTPLVPHTPPAEVHGFRNFSKRYRARSPVRRSATGGYPGIHNEHGSSSRTSRRSASPELEINSSDSSRCCSNTGSNAVSRNRGPALAAHRMLRASSAEKPPQHLSTAYTVDDSEEELDEEEDDDDDVSSLRPTQDFSVAGDDDDQYEAEPGMDEDQFYPTPEGHYAGGEHYQEQGQVNDPYYHEAQQISAHDSATDNIAHSGASQIDHDVQDRVDNWVHFESGGL